MRTELLEQWAKALEEIPAEKFDLSVWGRVPEMSYEDFQDRSEESPDYSFPPRRLKVEPSCVTAACAAGWLPSIWKKDFGLYQFGPTASACTVRHLPSGREDTEAVMEFFDLEEGQAGIIVDPEYYYPDDRSGPGGEILPQDAARRIREVIAGLTPDKLLERQGIGW